VATGTVTWIDEGRGCCFIASDLPGRDLYVDRVEVDSRSTALSVGVTVEFAVRIGRRGRFVVTNVAVKEPANGSPELSQTAAEVATDAWEGEGGAFR
jgi:cold shock CspA family protein